MSHNYTAQLVVQRGLEDTFGSQLRELDSLWEEVRESTAVLDLDVVFKEAIQLEMILVKSIEQVAKTPTLVESEPVDPTQPEQVSKSRWDKSSSAESGVKKRSGPAMGIRSWSQKKSGTS